MAATTLSTWKKAVLINGAGLIGIGVSLFLVPPSTPVWLWATISILVLAGLNYMFVVRVGWGSVNADPKSQLQNTIIICLGLLVLLTELLFRYVHR